MAMNIAVDVIHKGTPSPTGAERAYEKSLLRRRDETLARVREGYEEWKRTKIYKIPQWLYGPPKGELFKVACEDVPNFGDTSYLEFDAARTAFISIDWQVDFCGEHGYVDVMGYPLDNTANPLKYAARALKDIRDSGISVVHCREGHVPDLSDCPYNKILRSKIIGKNAVGIGEKPEGALAHCSFEDQ
jgi:biuret amidohydrolase